MMAGTAGFDPDHRWRELLEERHHLVTPELFAQNRDTGVIYPMKLKNVLRRIHSNSANLVHGRSPLFEINTRPHSGTLDAAGGRPHQQNLPLDGTAVAECWGGEVGVMADGCILLMPAGGRLLGGPPTKGDHHVAITCADDRGHDAGRVGPRDAAGLHPGGTPIGCALPAFAGPAQRGRGAGLPARLAPGPTSTV